MQNLFGEQVGPPQLSIEEQVRYVLEHHPETRDNDGLLLVTVWELFYNLHNYISPICSGALAVFMDKPHVPSSETITRRRREIQYDSGELVASESVEKHRLDRAAMGPPR